MSWTYRSNSQIGQGVLERLSDFAVCVRATGKAIYLRSKRDQLRVNLPAHPTHLGIDFKPLQRIPNLAQPSLRSAQSLLIRQSIISCGIESSSAQRVPGIQNDIDFCFGVVGVEGAWDVWAYIGTAQKEGGDFGRHCVVDMLNCDELENP